MAKSSNNGCAGGIGGVIFFIIVLVAMVPKEVWITLGVGIVVVALIAGAIKGMNAYDKYRVAEAERQRIQREIEAAAAKQRQEEQAKRARQQRIQTLGAKNAELVESTVRAIRRISASEAARAGWLGDVDFNPDVRNITDNFRKAHELRKVADDLSALDDPGPDDRKILAEATETVANLESAALERVDLIARCAAEAQLIDESLRQERKDAKTAEQRAELHAKLSAMLYGIEAAPPTTPTDSGADAVMARVQAYREIKEQIHRAREY